MSVQVVAVGRPELPPFAMPERFRTDVAYFMSLPGEPGVPTLQPGEYWVSATRARAWLDDGVFRIISPLDSAAEAEVELSEEQEAWLEWMTEHGIEQIRLD